MTKTPKQSVIIILVLFITIICLLSLEQPKDKAQIYRNIVVIISSYKDIIEVADKVIDLSSVYESQ